MKHHAPRVLMAAVLVLVAASSLLMISCGGGSDSSSSNQIDAYFQASTAGAAANRVRLTGTDVSSNLVRVDVAIGGPTTSQDIYAFAFDIVISNTTVAQFVAGSADFGSALAPGTGNNYSVHAVQEGSRVIVGVTKLGAIPGNGIGAGEETIVSLNFRINSRGDSNLTLAGSPSNPQNPSNGPAAIDSTGSVISSITFDAGSATIGG